MSTLTLTEQAAPSTPSAGKAVFYIKADGLLYTKDDAGVESRVNASSITAEIAAAIAAFLLTLDKTDVGLGNVDNTSDVTKDAAVATLTNKTLMSPVIATLSATGNTTLGDAAGDTLNVANGSLLLNASGNLGLGVTPSAWGALKSLDITAGAGFAGSTGGAYVVQNAYFNNNANWIYKTTFPAVRYAAELGAHYWFTAPSGTPGNPITFTQGMTLTASNNLEVAGTIKTGGYTVATLPAGASGDRAYVTDATAPTWNGALTGGGAVVVPVFKNASAWVSA